VRRVLARSLATLAAAHATAAPPSLQGSGRLVHVESGEPLRMFRRRYESGRVFGPDLGLGRYGGRWGYGHWHLVPDGEGVLQILSGNRKYCLGGTGEGESLELARCVAGLAAQRWRAEAPPGGGFRLRELASGRLLAALPDARARRGVRLVREGAPVPAGWRLEPRPRGRSGTASEIRAPRPEPDRS